jgi:F420-0:gamma-glutamyl ligase-like protein
LKLSVIKVKTKYWRPGTDYFSQIMYAVDKYVKGGDIIVISEKALAIASGKILDESIVKPRSLARFLAKTWMNKVWVYGLGLLVNFDRKTLENLRNYPTNVCAAHKETALQNTGFLQTLRHYSEGGIDASNLPYSYVSLPLDNANIIAEKIRGKIEEYGYKVTVLIVDGDTTYSWRNLHLAPRAVDVPGLVHKGGFLTFVIGRLFNLKKRATPIALAGENINPDRALWFAHLAHNVSGSGAGRTVWGMSKRFEVDLTSVTWEMLETVDHSPIVVIRILDSKS